MEGDPSRVGPDPAHGGTMSKVKIAVTAGTVLVLAGVTVGFSLRGHGGDAVAVQAEPAQRLRVVQKVNATGKIQPVTQVKISADVSAKITRLAVEEGDWVEKGQLLLELDRERYVAAVESAEANLRAAQANVDLVRENMVKVGKDLERTRSLHGQDLESVASLDSAVASAEVEKARHQAALDQMEQARAALKQARDDLAKTTIYAPLSGTVSVLNKEPGEIALGSQFQEDVIMVISNLAGMEALVDVDENDIVAVALADAAEVEVDALPDLVLAGTVTEIASSAKTTAAGTTDQKTEFEVKVGITSPSSSLRPGMTASADIVVEVREDVVAVPVQCVTVRTPGELSGGGRQGGPPPRAAGGEGGAARFAPDRRGYVEVVWVVEDGRAEARQVRTGVQGEDHIEILEGLEEGEQVVVGSYRAISRDLRDGAPVRLEAAPGPARG